MSVKVVSKLEFIEYRNEMFRRLYSNIAIVVFSLASIIFLFQAIDSLINTKEGQEIFYIGFIMPFVILIGIPSILYFRIKKSFSADGRLSEAMTYVFESDSFSVTGETFESKLTWNKI